MGCVPEDGRNSTTGDGSTVDALAVADGDDSSAPIAGVVHTMLLAINLMMTIGLVC